MIPHQQYPAQFPRMNTLQKPVQVEGYKAFVSMDPILDVTPTLYSLLGHRPILNQQLFGRPLFTDTPEERMPNRRDSHVMASSYGPFYGVLDAVGKILSRFDAASYREYFYDLTTGPAGMAFRPTEATHAAAVKSLRAAIAAITRFYNVPVPLR